MWKRDFSPALVILGIVGLIVSLPLLLRQNPPPASRPEAATAPAPQEPVAEQPPDNLTALTEEERQLYKRADRLDQLMLHALNYQRSYAESLDDSASPAERAAAEAELQRFEGYLEQLKQHNAEE